MLLARPDRRSALIGLFLGSLFFRLDLRQPSAGRKLPVSFVLITVASVMQFYAETAMAAVVQHPDRHCWAATSASATQWLPSFAEETSRRVLGSFSVI